MSLTGIHFYKFRLVCRTSPPQWKSAIEAFVVILLIQCVGLRASTDLAISG